MFGQPFLFTLSILILWTQVMRLCWATMPEDRPGFRPIKEQLSSIAQTLELQIQWKPKSSQTFWWYNSAQWREQERVYRVIKGSLTQWKEEIETGDDLVFMRRSFNKSPAQQREDTWSSFPLDNSRVYIFLCCGWGPDISLLRQTLGSILLW